MNKENKGTGMPAPKIPAAAQHKNEKAAEEREKHNATHGDPAQVGGGKVDDHDHTPEEAGSDVDLRQMTGSPSDQTGVVADKTIVQNKDGEDVVKKSSPIDVVAIADGYYRQERKKPGDKFTIEGEHQLGKWMEII